MSQNAASEPLIEKIRRETKTSHSKLDHSVYPIVQRIRSKEDYAKLLTTFYGYFRPVYESIDQHLDKGLLPDYGMRRKPEVLLEDLKAIGQHTNGLQLCTDIPAIHSAAAAHGALYVLEGSTMGGPILSKKIAENLGSEEGLRFFSGYGDANGRMWSFFLESLGKITGPQEQAEAVQAASETFAKFGAWIDSSYA